MLAAARDARMLAEGLAYDALMGDVRTRLALERALEIIGEAARRVSSATRNANPAIPWTGIIGTRNAWRISTGRSPTGGCTQPRTKACRG